RCTAAAKFWVCCDCSAAESCVAAWRCMSRAAELWRLAASFCRKAARAESSVTMAIKVTATALKRLVARSRAVRWVASVRSDWGDSSGLSGSSADMTASLHHAAFDRNRDGDRADDDQHAQACHDIAQAIFQNIGDGKAQQCDCQHGDEPQQL